MKNFYTVTTERAGECVTLKYSGLHSVRLALAALSSPFHPERRRGATVTIERNGATLATLAGAAICDIFTVRGVNKLQERAQDLKDIEQLKADREKRAARKYWRK